jgi:hypothetical protein
VQGDSFYFFCQHTDSSKGSHIETLFGFVGGPLCLFSNSNLVRVRLG